MKEVFETLLPIKESTGLDIDLYSNEGILLFTTNDEKPSYKFTYHKEADFKDNIIMDKNCDVTYFLARNNKSYFVGVIKGSNDISRNYAVMVLSLIEKTVYSSKQVIDKETKFRLYLRGELNKLQYTALKADYDVKDFHYYVLTLIISSKGKLSDLKQFLQTMAEAEDIVIETDAKTIVFFKKCKSGDEYSSANDFAYILYENIKEELRIELKISVAGAAHSFDGLITAYQDSLFAYSFGSLIDPDSSVYSYKEYVMVKMLSDIPRDSLEKYSNTLLDNQSLQILKDEELMHTAEIFMRNSLNISETSRNMYVHRNTLIYRLDKIENATGLNIRHFNDAVIFRLIIMLNKLTDK